MDKNVTDTVLIGAGPIGIEMAAALKREQIPYRHLEGGQVGSTIFWWAPNTRFFSSADRIEIAGVPLQRSGSDKPSREEYLAYLRGVVRQFELKVETDSRVNEITTDNKNFTLSVSHGRGISTIYCNKVILAIGDMHRPRLLNIPGEDLPHVSHYLKEPHLYFRKRVLIVGGKNSAIEAALRLYHIGADVTLSYRGDGFDPKRIKYWLYPEITGRIKRGEIDFIPSSTAIKITDHEVVLAKSSNEQSTVSADAVLLLTGYEQDSSLFESVGVTLSGPGKTPTIDPQTMETNVKGLFVAGTAVGGTQLGGVKLFIENTHIHVHKIIAALQGRAAPTEGATERELES